MSKMYVKVSQDKYELIECWAENIQALANKLGMPRNNIESCITKSKRHGRNSMYKVIEFDEEDNFDDLICNQEEV